MGRNLLHNSIMIIVALLSNQVYAEQVIIEGDGFVVTDTQILNELSIQQKELREKIEQNPRELKKLIDGIYNELAFANQAKRKGLDKNGLVALKIEASKRRVLVQELMNEKKESLVIPDMEPLAKSYYDAHPDLFHTNESVEVRHILIEFNSDNKEEKKAFVNELVGRINEGEKFEDIAKKYSDDKGSAVRGGNLSRFTRGQMAKPFEEASFNLSEKGNLTEIVETKHGFHVIQLIDISPKKRKAFDQVKNQIIPKLENEYIKVEMYSWRKEIIDPSKVKINKPEMESLIQEIGKNKAPDIAVDKKVSPPETK